MKINEFLYSLCAKAENMIKNNKQKDCKIIEAIGEVKINNTDYQVQVYLEPDQNEWVAENETVFRIER